MRKLLQRLAEAGSAITLITLRLCLGVMSLLTEHCRHRLMEIDSHILGLSMEFEKQNIIITEWETEKAKSRSDNIYERRKRKRIRKRQPKIYLEPTDSEPNDDEEEDYDDCDDGKNDDNESGFEVKNLTF